MITRVAAAFLFLFISPSLLGQMKPTSAEAQVRDALANFIHAFDNLDWESFRLAFSDDATVFYPRGFPERATGCAEFEKTFKVVFDQIRDGKTGASYMDVQPRDVEIQLFGNIAITTFHLDDRAGFLYSAAIRNRGVLKMQEDPFHGEQLRALDFFPSS